MPPRRKALPVRIETEVLIRCRRRCCLCVHLDGRGEVRQGQIAHLNHRRDDHRFENLVWLCLDHHDQFDSRTSQSKGLTETEVRHYRDRLIASYPPVAGADNAHPDSIEQLGEPQTAILGISDQVGGTPAMPRPWRFPLWHSPDQLELFAYVTSGGTDGVCLIERIDLPDGRIVVACVQTPGNPGQSITNAVEAICEQVCERFDVPPHRLVWLEHYSFIDPQEWSWVTFEKAPPQEPFAGPRWIEMTPAHWASLQLSPMRRLKMVGGGYMSKLRKHFPWPPDEEQARSRR